MKESRVTEPLLRTLYEKEEKSIRKIASELKLGKNTISYYLQKFQINTRTHSQASKIHFSHQRNWNYGLTKEKDERISILSEKIKRGLQRRQEQRFFVIEKDRKIPLREVISRLYWDQYLTQDKIAKELKLSRGLIISLMKRYNISKRPNFQHIASLKGKNHSHFGRKWESIFGPERARELKEKVANAARKSIIHRLGNGLIPFSETKIEVSLALEMKKQGIKFEKQYPINDKFVCDFGLFDHKIIIECDGDYWHSNPQIYSHRKLDSRQKRNLQRDKIKDKYLQKEGWQVLHFFETEIKNDINGCINEIRKAIETSQEQMKKVRSPLDTLE